MDVKGRQFPHGGGAAGNGELQQSRLVPRSGIRSTKGPGGGRNPAVADGADAAALYACPDGVSQACAEEPFACRRQFRKFDDVTPDDRGRRLDLHGGFDWNPGLVRGEEGLRERNGRADQKQGHYHAAACDSLQGGRDADSGQPQAESQRRGHQDADQALKREGDEGWPRCTAATGRESYVSAGGGLAPAPRQRGSQAARAEGSDHERAQCVSPGTRRRRGPPSSPETGLLPRPRATWKLHFSRRPRTLVSSFQVQQLSQRAAGQASKLIVERAGFLKEAEHFADTFAGLFVVGVAVAGSQSALAQDLQCGGRFRGACVRRG